MRKTVLFVWALLSILIYGSILISPKYFEYIGLLGFTIPGFMFLNIILFFIAWIKGWPSKWMFTLLVLVVWPFYGLVYQFNSNTEPTKGSIKMLSYNVKWFVDARDDNYKEVTDWIISQEADILCFQEFYPLNGIQDKIGKGYYVSTDNYEFHTAIFSKYPIIQEGLLFEKESLNNVRFADLKTPKGIIRVYNVHLQSMGIQPEKINGYDPSQAEIEDLGFRFTSASQVRARQMDILRDHIKETDYPVLVSGDFNDIPFSNNYMKLSRILKNSFEEKGRGFGITFNNRIPFLRIDHHFSSDEVNVQSFETVNKIFYSDHFPLIGIYDITF